MNRLHIATQPLQRPLPAVRRHRRCVLLQPALQRVFLSLWSPWRAMLLRDRVLIMTGATSFDVLPTSV